MEPSDEIGLWLWEYTDELGKRTRSTWRMSEETVRKFANVYRGAVKVDGWLEWRRPLGLTRDWKSGDWNSALMSDRKRTGQPAELPCVDCISVKEASGKDTGKSR